MATEEIGRLDRDGLAEPLGEIQRRIENLVVIRFQADRESSLQIVFEQLQARLELGCR